LEESAGKGLKGAGKRGRVRETVMKAEYSDILLT
jgi:hypothetical protein